MNCGKAATFLAAATLVLASSSRMAGFAGAAGYEFDGAPRLTASTDWSRVQNLRSGQQVFIIADGTGSLARVFLVADDNSVLLMNSRAGAIKGIAARIERVATRRAASVASVIAGSGASVESEGLAIRANGIFDGDRRLAALDEVFRKFDRSAVIEVAVDGKTARDKRGIALAFAGVAAMVVGGIAKNPEGGPGAGFYVGLPLVAAGIGFTHGEHAREGVIYRRAEVDR